MFVHNVESNRRQIGGATALIPAVGHSSTPAGCYNPAMASSTARPIPAMKACSAPSSPAATGRGRSTPHGRYAPATASLMPTGSFWPRAGELRREPASRAGKTNLSVGKIFR